MRGVIKGALAEELDNSLRMKKEYEVALANLPKGCLTVRNIRGHRYYYLAQRVGKKVTHVYKGKISNEEIKKYDEAKALRLKYRKLLSQVKKQIRFLKGALRGKEAV